MSRKNVSSGRIDISFDGSIQLTLRIPSDAVEGFLVQNQANESKLTDQSVYSFFTIC